MGVMLREWYLVKAKKGQWAQGLVFYSLVAFLVPLVHQQGFSTDPVLGALLVWTALLLASMLTMDASLSHDFEDGSFDHWMLSPKPLWVLMGLKSLSHWLFWILPMVLISPLVALMMGLSVQESLNLLVSMMVGTPVLSFLGLGCACLTSSLQSGVLLSLMVIPLVLPVLLMGCLSVAQPEQANAYYALAGAMSIFCVTGLPHVAAFGVRMNS